MTWEIDSLLDDHMHLRGLIAQLNDALDEAEAQNADPHMRQAILERSLPETAETLFKALQTHEEIERLLLSDESLQACGCPRAEIEAQHESIHSMWSVFSALLSLKGNEDLYSVRFTMNRIAENLNSHFKYEEENLFPRLTAALESPKTAAH